MVRIVLTATACAVVTSGVACTPSGPGGTEVVPCSVSDDCDAGLLCVDEVCTAPPACQPEWFGFHYATTTVRICTEPCDAQVVPLLDFVSRDQWSFEYEAGRLVRSAGNFEEWRFAYDDRGLRESASRTSGSVNGPSVSAYRFEYSNALLLASHFDVDPESGVDSSRVDFTYGDDNQILLESFYDLSSGTEVFEGSTVFHYDGIHLESYDSLDAAGVVTDTVFVDTDAAGRPIELRGQVENEDGVPITEIFHTLRWADTGELLSDQLFDVQRTDYFYETCR